MLTSLRFNMPVVKDGGVGEAVLRVGELMAVSARTAPKARGIDDISIVLLTGEDMLRVADEMERIGRETGRQFFIRDSGNVRGSAALLLVGVKASKPKRLDCGACGYKTCEEFERAGRVQGRDFDGPSCMLQLLDLGIALGSAVKTASLMNVDNRIMFTVGVAAVKLGLIDADVAMGVPLSATGKSPYFDRK